MMGAFQNPVLEGLIAGNQVRQARERAAMESFRVKAAVEDQINQAFERKQDRMIREAVEKNRLMQTGAMPVSDGGTVSLDVDIGLPGQASIPLRGALPVDQSGLPVLELGGSKFAIPDQKMQRANELFARRDLNEEAVRLYAAQRKADDDLRRADDVLVTPELETAHPSLRGLAGRSLDPAKLAEIFGKENDQAFQLGRDEAMRKHQAALAEATRKHQETQGDKNRATQVQVTGMRKADSGGDARYEQLADVIEIVPSAIDQITPTDRGKVLPILQKRGFTQFGTQLPASAVKEIAQSESAITSLQDLRKTLKDNEQYIGPISGFQAYWPYSDAKKAQSTIDLVRQRVGKTLEGGVLRKEDEEKYKKILATLNDEPSTAIFKVDNLIKTIENDIATFKDEHRKSGRRVDTGGKKPASGGAKAEAFDPRNRK